tara:strand:- start:918 stop:1106 length:189 start_codon:yes stop_codon:yes gene_type:complete
MVEIRRDLNFIADMFDQCQKNIKSIVPTPIPSLPSESVHLLSEEQNWEIGDGDVSVSWNSSG